MTTGIRDSASSASVDLQDPRVQQMLDMGGGRVATGNAKEVVHLAGDEERGLQSTVMLNDGKREVLVLYQDLVMTLDVYAIPGEPTKIHLICPRCRKLSTIDSSRKHVDLDLLAPNPARSAILALGKLSPTLVAGAQLGRLYVEAFTCAWEMGAERHRPGALQRTDSLCNLRLVIDRNIAREV